MIALFIILYIAGIWLIYAKLRVRPTAWNLAGVAVLGVVIIGTIVIGWQFSAPVSSQVVVVRPTIQIVPQVKGPISRIVAKPNVRLTKGEDILFEIQQDPYQFAVRQRKAALGAAEKNVEQLQAGLKVAAASITEATARMAAANMDYKAKQEVNERSAGAVSELELSNLQERYAATQAGVDKARAVSEEATFALDAAKQQVEQAQADLDQAEFDLTQCTVYAPADGFVTNWQVREGAMAVSLPLAPMGTFIDTSQVDVVAVFGQNVLKNVQPGDKVDIALKSHPGQIFSGTVEAIIEASGEGQFVTAGQMMTASQIHSDGKFAVKLTLDDEDFAQSIAMGTSGVVTIYTDQGSTFHIISSVTVRIQAWIYYLLPI